MREAQGGASAGVGEFTAPIRDKETRADAGGGHGGVPAFDGLHGIAFESKP